jgi:hypothetical protein
MRRSFVAVALAVVAIGASAVQAQAQTAPPAQQPAAAPAQAPAADPLKFTTDDAIVIFQVTAGKETDFETGFKSMLTALNGSAKPELKALGGSMTLSKAQITSPNAMYVLNIHGASKTLSYAWGKIIYYSGGEASATPAMIVEKREDADAMFKQIGDSIATAGGAPQVSVLPLVKIGG